MFLPVRNNLRAENMSIADFPWVVDNRDPTESFECGMRGNADSGAHARPRDSPLNRFSSQLFPGREYGRTHNVRRMVAARGEQSKADMRHQSPNPEYVGLGEIS